MLPPSPQKQYQ